MRSINRWVAVGLVGAVLTSGCSLMGSDADDPIEPEYQEPAKVSKPVELPKPESVVSEDVKKMQDKVNPTDSANEMSEEQKGEIRRKAIAESGNVWGLQRGLYERTQEIQKILDKNRTNLDLIFDARKFIVEGKVLLPVISEATQIYDQTAEKEARMVTTSYTVAKEAVIVPFAPTWRDYLIRGVDAPTEPDVSLLPRTKREREVWKNATEKGWLAGRKQADEVFELDLRRLQFDTEGRYRFKKLAAMGVLSNPKVSASDMATLTLDDGRTLNINDVVYKIVVDSKFQESGKWSPQANANGR